MLEVDSLVKVYRVAEKLVGNKVYVRALDGVDLQVYQGETLGIVGESGCGKSTLGRLIVSLDQPTSGRILFKGRDVTRLKKEELKGFRRRVQIVFQDPASSLNPRKTVGETLMEPLIVHKVGNLSEREERVREILKSVGLLSEYAKRYPHELSGGQRQRVCIARAIILAPELVVADEPVSSLDVSIQAQILNLLKDLRDHFNLTYIFISHDLKVVRFMSDRVAVMYAGSIMELALSETIYKEPCHPYTQALLAAIPSLRPSEGKQRENKVVLPQGLELTKEGCAFLPRCFKREKICEHKKPALKEVRHGHWVACHLA